MADWSASMQQTFEYYIVNPLTWKDTKLIKTVTSCTISRDLEAETLGSASFEIDENSNDDEKISGEHYIRVYLVAIQNGIRERRPLGTYLIQTPSYKFDGKVKSVSMDAYTPLLELKEKPTPLGYYVPKNENIMDHVYSLTRDNLRAPVVKPSCDKTTYSNFVADTNDTFMSFLKDLASNAQYRFDLDELGRILYSPVQNLESMQPVWTFDDGNSSILYPDLTEDYDLYGIPNVVEVVYSNVYTVRVVNDDPTSPTSTVNRGREILHRDTSPSLTGNPTNEQIDEYAKQLLKSLSTIETTISYTHGYHPNVRIGDCVRLNYSRAGLDNVKAQIISQSISCSSGCKVTEKAVYTKKLWKG